MAGLTGYIFLLSAVLLFGFIPTNVKCAKILILPFPTGGHVNEAANIGGVLVAKGKKDSRWM